MATGLSENFPPKVNARMQELDRMRSRTKRIRSDFFERRSEQIATDPASGAISHRPRRFLKPSHIQQPDPCLGDLKYYTEVTIRPTKAEQFQFNALNRNSVPAPHWNSPRPVTSEYRTSQLGDWETEVLKPPQEIQSYSRQIRISTPKVSGSNSDDWNATMQTMFRPVDRFDVPAREYAVDPEWVSEDERIAKARAGRLLQARAG